MTEEKVCFIKTIIYRGEADPASVAAFKAKNINIISWEELLSLGKAHISPHNPPNPDDLALIM